MSNARLSRRFYLPTLEKEDTGDISYVSQMKVTGTYNNQMSATQDCTRCVRDYLPSNSLRIDS